MVYYKDYTTKTNLMSLVTKYVSENKTEKVLAPEKKVTGQKVGTYVTEKTIAIDGYTVAGEDTKTLLI